MVGSNQGQVHSERQGTGLATVLQGDRAYIEGQKYQLDKKAKQTELKTRRDLAFKQLNDFHPEYWDKDNAAIQSELDALVDEGGKLIAMSKSGDPFTDVTPEALAFQKKFNLVRGLAQKSKQAMAEDIAIRAELRGKDIEDYDAHALAAYGDWLKTPISQRGQAPIIGKATPLLNLTKEAGAVRTAFAEQFGENEVPNDALIKNTRDQFTDPKWAAGIVPALTQSYLSLTPAEQVAVQEAADANHLSLPEQLWTDISKRSLKMGKPFELNAFVDKLANGFQVDEIAYGNAEGTGTTFDKKKYEAEKQRRALLGTLDDPRAVDALLKAGIIEKEIGDDELALRKKAAGFLAKEIDSRVKTLTGFVPYKKSESEIGKAEDIAKSNEWYSNLMSGDMGLKERAATELRMRKMPDGSTIESSSVFTQTQPDGSQKSFMTIQLNPRKEVSDKGISDEMLDAEKQRLAATGTTVIEMLPAPERKEYEGMDATGKKVKEKELLRQNILAPKVIIELKPENENIFKNLYNPEAKAMASSYSAGQKGSLWGGVAKAAPVTTKKRY